MKQWNRLLCVLVVLCLAFAGLVAAGTRAQAAEIVASGDAGAEGSSITWTLDSEGTLTLSGTGETMDYDTRVAGGDPWAYQDINRIVVEPGITVLGDGIFANLGYVPEISLPEGLTTIGAYCFQSTDIPQVHLPVSVTTLKAMCFRNSNSSIWFYGDKPKDLFAYDYDDYESWYYYTSITVYYPSWSVSWNSVALDGVDDRHVTLKDNGTEPDKTVYFDKTYEDGLHVTITKDGYATVTGTGESVLKQSNYPYEARHVVVGEGVAALGNQCGESYSGYNDDGLIVRASCTQTLEIGDSVTTIGEEAFAGANHLTTLKLGSGITEIGKGAFTQCPDLKDVWFTCKCPADLDRGYNGYLQENTFTLHYPDWDVSWDGQDVAESNVTWQAESGIPIPEGAESVIVDSGRAAYVDWTLSRTGVLTISGEGAMEGNSYTEPTPLQLGVEFANKIRSVVIESGITNVGSQAFANAPHLTTVVIGDTVTSIGSRAFGNCPITELTLPQGLESIGSWAFDGAPIANIAIPDSVTSINKYAFRGHRTEKIVLPAGLTTLGTEAFDSEAMTELWFYGSRPVELYWSGSDDYNNPDVFRQNLPYGADWAGTVYFPDWNITWEGWDTRTNGLNATWLPNGTQAEALVLESGTCDTGDTGDEIFWSVTADGVLTLSGHGVIPDAEGYMEDTAYKHQNENIRHVVIESGITGLGARFLNDLNYLETVTLPDTLEVIKAVDFAGAENLTSLVIPASVQTIKDRAFAGRSLTEVRFLGSAPQTMYKNCFYGLENLTLYYPAGDYTWKGWINENGIHSFEMGSGSLTPVGEAGEVAEYVWKTGTYGGNFTYSLTNMGKLTIEGAEGNALISDAFPNWVREVLVGEQVNSFNWNAFSALALETVRFSGSAPHFNGTLNDCDATVYYPAWDMTWYEALRTQQGDSLVWVDDGSQVVERILLSGDCGENLTYTLNNLGVLAIEGTGRMYNYENVYEEEEDWDDEFHNLPWWDEGNIIHEIRLSEGVTSIGREAFWNLQNVTGLTLPEAVTEIGDYAFAGCSNLSQLVLPANLETIGCQAFCDTGLTSIVIPDSVTAIGNYAFATCEALSSVKLPAGLTDLSEGIFLSSENLTEVELPSGLETIGAYAFRGSGLPAIVIPESVTSIGKAAFNESGLTSVVIPESVTSIGEAAFSACAALTEVVMPSDLETMGAYLFDGCSALTSVNLPENLTELPYDTFRGCSALASITLPEGLIIIAEDAFKDCTALTELVLPESLKEIRIEALQNSGLVSIDLTGVEILGIGVLRDCASLTDVILPEISTLPQNLLSGCTALTEIEIPNSVRRLDRDVFAGCTGLSKIHFRGDIPDVYNSEEYDYDIGETVSITSFGGIDATIFYPGWDIRWQMLDRGQWDEELYWQGREETPNPKELDRGRCSTEGDVYWTLNTAGDLVISGSGPMTDYIVRMDEYGTMLEEPIIKDTPWEKYKPYIRTVVIKDGVTRLGDGALQNCSRLDTVTLPASDCTILNEVFTGCGSPTLIFTGDPLSIAYNALKGHSGVIRYPDYFTWEGRTMEYGGSSTWEKQASEAVDDPSLVAQGYSHYLIWKLNRDGQLTLTTRNRPEGETLNMESYFASRTTWPWDNYKDSITSIILGEGLYDVPYGAFDHCRLLTSLTLPDSLTRIGQSAFRNCELLTEVRMGPALKTIDPEAFYGCTALTAVYMGESLTDVDDNAFEGCTNLHTIHVPSLVQWMENPCLNINREDNRDYALYIAGTAAEHIVIPGTFEELRMEDSRDSWGNWNSYDSFFENCTNIKQITISEGVREIGSNALANIPNLTTLVIPGSVTHLDNNILYSCEKLEKIFFTGLAPLFSGSTFSGVEATAYYPGSNPSWTELKRQDYGGDIRWVDSDAPHTHSYGAWATSLEPGCETEGQQSRSCSLCGATETQSIPAVGHSYGQWETVINPTCQGIGVQKRHCKHCDACEEESLPVVEHSYDEGTVTTEPGCDTEGEKTFACTVCGDSYTEPVPAAGHVYDEAVETPATCTEPGSRTAECTVCGQTVTEELPATGHSFGDWGITKPATGEEEGERKRTCTACGQKETEVIPVVTITFGDVKETDWFAPMVNWAVAKGITSGVGNNNFAPGKNCTRAQVVTFLWRAQGCPEPTRTDNPFTDVPENAYYYKSVMWALENGITSGTTATTFGPDSSCTRGQVVTFLWRANGKPTPTKTDNPFVDVPEGAYYYEPVLWAVENGITSGVSANQFKPTGICTRAQVVTFLYRNAKQ